MAGLSRKLIDQLLLDYLTRWPHRKCLENFEPLGQLVLGDPAAREVVTNAGQIERPMARSHDTAARFFTENGIRDRDDCDLGDLRMQMEQIFDLAGIILDAATIDDVLDASYDRQVAVLASECFVSRL